MNVKISERCRTKRVNVVCVHNPFTRNFRGSELIYREERVHSWLPGLEACGEKHEGRVGRGQEEMCRGEGCTVLFMASRVYADLKGYPSARLMMCSLF